MDNLSLSKSTVELLKNFATVNGTLLFQEGSELETRSVRKNIWVKATITEKLPKTFVIYDLHQFLGVLNNFDSPVLDFDVSEEFVKIADAAGGQSVLYRYANEELAYVPDPKKKLVLPSTDVEFLLTEVDLKSVTNMARTLNTPKLALQSDRKEMKLVTLDPKNSATNTSILQMGKHDASFSLVWTLEDLKMVPGTYKVAISKKGLSRFEHNELALVYHILLDVSSEYEA